jgi:hypothetical protein
VETTVQAVLASVDGTLLGKVRPCDIHKIANSLKLRKAFGPDGIPNECLNQIVFVMETQYGSYEVGIEFSNVISMNCRFQRANVL